MPYLLDTHTLIWALSDPDRLGTDARTLLEDRSSELFVSAASAWELSTKARTGKLPQFEAFVPGLSHHLSRLGVTDLPITPDDAATAGGLRWEHRDPFDRMLAAQCLVRGWTLVTRDAAFHGIPGLSSMW